MLQIKNYTLYTNMKQILRIHELNIDPGQLVYIQGDNSCGKSLFLKSLTGKYSDYHGEISFKKQPIHVHLNKNNIIMIDNELPVLKDKTYLENIQIPFGELTMTQKNRLIEMATILKALDTLNDKMEYSSHSEKVIMYLLRAALISPSLLLIDDLDNYFDQDSSMNVLHFIQYCLKSGIIFIATGKSKIENVVHLAIHKGELVRNES